MTSSMNRNGPRSDPISELNEMTPGPGPLPPAQPANETLADFLDRRERELMHRLAAIQGEMAPLEAEISQIRRAKAAVATPPTIDNSVPPRNANYVDALRPFLEVKPMGIGTVSGSGALMTIKQLVIRALLHQFRDGATPAQLREFIRDAYGRDIERSSLSPQLSRLKAGGIVEQPNLLNDVWKLAPGTPFTSVEDRLAALEAEDANNTGQPTSKIITDPTEAALKAIQAALELKGNEAPSDTRSEGAPKSPTGVAPVKRRG
jgi:hypothetical protein